jgi:hypothetical protein
MPQNPSTSQSVLDSRQLARIESVHCGFLFQHLYAMACLFMAAEAGATKVVVEHDEDVEIVLPAARIYVQVKTRNAPLIFSDIDGAMQRFDTLRGAHTQLISNHTIVHKRGRVNDLAFNLSAVRSSTPAGSRNGPAAGLTRLRLGRPTPSCP